MEKFGDESQSNDSENSLEKKLIKKGIEYVFEQHSELGSIGTQEQYSEYLDTIFPESKIKNILYHGTREENRFDSFDTSNEVTARNFGKGIYLAADKIEAEKYVFKGGHMVNAIVNIKNPFITCNRLNAYYGAYVMGMRSGEKISDYLDNDSVINYTNLDRDSFKKINPYMIEYLGEKNEIGLPAYQKDIYTTPEIREIIIEDPIQTHILGTKSDIEKFKEFVG